MGYLEELHAFGAAEVSSVIADIQEEFSMPAAETVPAADMQPEDSNPLVLPSQPEALPVLENMNERLSKMERSVVSILDAVKKIVSMPRPRKSSEEEI